MYKDFDSWNIRKRKLENRLNLPMPKERSVWVCRIGENIGSEQCGPKPLFDRPALVVKKFNNSMYWVIPLSSKQKDLDYYFNFTDPHGKLVSAILAQMKLVSVKRFMREMYVMPKDTYTTLITEVRNILNT